MYVWLSGPSGMMDLLQVEVGLSRSHRLDLICTIEIQPTPKSSILKTNNYCDKLSVLT